MFAKRFNENFNTWRNNIYRNSYSNIKTTIEVIRSALLITGSFGLLLSAILIIKKKSESPLKYIDQWKEKFKVFSYKVVLIFSSIIILLCGGIIDWFLFYKL